MTANLFHKITHNLTGLAPKRGTPIAFCRSRDNECLAKIKLYAAAVTSFQHHCLTFDQVHNVAASISGRADFALEFIAMYGKEQRFMRAHEHLTPAIAFSQ